MNTTPFYFYAVIAFIIAIVITLKSKTNYPLVTFVIVYWLLAGSVLETKYFYINLRYWSFDLQPSRIIFILFSIYYINLILFHAEQQEGEKQHPIFEKFIYIFIILYSLSNFVHLKDSLTMRDAIQSITKLLTFLLIYLTLKRIADEKVIKAIIQGMIVVCVISALIGIYQFFFNSEFFRFGTEYRAFSNFLRSNGIFKAEYYQSYFLLPGLLLVLYVIKEKVPRLFLVGLLLIGIFLTFHRMSWIITALLLILYMLINKKIRIWQIAILGIFITVFSYVTVNINPFFVDNISEDPLVKERLMSDSVTRRMAYYNLALRNIPQNILFGIGGPKSEVYYYGMVNIGTTEEEAVGLIGGIHNLYLMTAFFYGIPVFISFLLLLLGILIYFIKKSKISQGNLLLTTLFIVMYIIANVSNIFPLTSDLGFLLSIFLGISVAAIQRNINIFGFDPVKDNAP